MTRLPIECLNPECNKTFTPTVNHQKFCSLPCRSHCEYTRMYPKLHGFPLTAKEAKMQGKTYYMAREAPCLKCTSKYRWAETSECIQCWPYKESA
jgi:hypothetical protein